ncbi:hypothetical protein [Shewanella dokdonensis]|nr:hypothetical protein [Shewanella dokdonensis]
MRLPLLLPPSHCYSYLPGSGTPDPAQFAAKSPIASRQKLKVME